MDAVALPVMLGRTLQVDSICPATGTAIRLTVGPTGVESAAPEETVISEVPPTEECDDVRSSVCDHGHFFAGPAAAEPWRRQHPTGCIRPVAETFEITRNRLIQLGWADAGSTS